jgi:hypothetical protein
MVASYNVAETAYKWAKALVDADNEVVSISGLAINYAETLLAAHGETPSNNNDFYIFLLDPSTGGRKYSTTKHSMPNKMYL